MLSAVEGLWSLQAAGAACSNMAGSLLLVGSADGSLTQVHSNLGDSDGSSSHVALHDMWAGRPCLLICLEHAELVSTRLNGFL